MSLLIFKDLSVTGFWVSQWALKNRQEKKRSERYPREADTVGVFHEAGGVDGHGNESVEAGERGWVLGLGGNVGRGYIYMNQITKLLAGLELI